MSRGNDLRQHSLQRQAQHQRQFDASSRHMRQAANTAHQGFQTRIRTQRDHTARMRHIQFQSDNAVGMTQQLQANNWHQQYHQAWPMDPIYPPFEPLTQRGGGSTFVTVFRFVLFLVWLAGMAWMVWTGVGG